MFKAMVIACSLVEPTECWEFKDTLGPHATYKQCYARAVEMSEDIKENFGQEMNPAKYECTELTGSTL